MSSTPSATSILADDALDEIASGVSTGKGILASMLSWLRPGSAAGRQLGALRSGVPSAPPVPVEIDESLKPQYGQFDAAWLLDSLQRYAKAYAKLIVGPGLIVRSDSALPPPAFRAIPRASLFNLPSPLHAHDYDNQDAAVRAMDNVELQHDQAQLAWMTNAILVRAALKMAPYVHGAIRLNVDPTGGGAKAVYSHAGVDHDVPVFQTSNPISLHRELHQGVLRAWGHAVATAETEVREEVIEALGQFPYSSKVVQQIDEIIRAALEESPILMRMRSSGAAFIDSAKLASTCEAFVASIDRGAVRNALRHDNAGLNWKSYTTHCDPKLQQAIQLAEVHGSLAYAHYPVDALQQLYALHGHAAAPFQSWRGWRGDYDYDGVFTQRFVESLQTNANAKLLAELRALSPRYLSCLASGHDRVTPLEISYGAAIADAWGCGDSTTAAVRAGRLLATALNRVLEGTAGCSARLPWARVLSHDTAQELLLRPMDDGAAIDGLTAFFGYANVLRSKKERMASSLERLPTAESLCSAPRTNVLGSMLEMNKELTPGGWAAAERAALALAVEMGGAAAPYLTTTATNSTPARLEWQTEMAACRIAHVNEPDLAGGVRFALRNPGRQLQAWTCLNVTAHTSADFSMTKEEDLGPGYNRFALRGAGTPDGVDPLVLQIKIPRGATAMTFSRSVKENAAHTNLQLRPITADAPKSALRLRDNAETQRRSDALSEHYTLLMAQARERVTQSIRKRPIHAACVFPAIALYLWKGGKLADHAELRPLGTTSAFKLARASVGAVNPYAMGLLCRHAANPAARSRSGVSLLDIALESKNYKLAQGALQGLAANSRLSKADLKALVQSSFGKLIERHPKLLQAALNCGVEVDEVARASWQRLHPEQLVPELSQVFEMAAMNAVIDAADSSAPATTQRRRMRAI